MRIIDDKGHDVDHVIGPYDEDSTLTLTCQVTGGDLTFFHSFIHSFIRSFIHSFIHFSSFFL